MLACGVACDMNYDPSASGSSVYTAVSGMKNYLGYNPYAYCARGDHYSPTEWVNMIKTELNAQRPVYFTASDNSYTGHAFILDGYDEEGLMHVDWGWSGMSNGYYLVAELQPELPAQAAVTAADTSLNKSWLWGWLRRPCCLTKYHTSKPTT